VEKESSNFWFLTEERPKTESIRTILELFATKNNIKINVTNLKIKPIFKNQKFTFEYEIKDAIIPDIDKIFLRIVSGNAGSFVDYLVFRQKDEPEPKNDNPLYIIEETKTTPKESRNVSVYQRLSKFVFVDFFKNIIKKAEKVMLYSIRTEYNTIPKTFVFGVRTMKTLDVNVVGLPQNYEKFSNVQDVINSKNSFSTKRSDNIPVMITLNDKKDTAYISAKLVKNNGLSDPNIGSTSAIAALIRKLDPNIKKIIIKNHGLNQSQVEKSKNKLIKLANKLNFELDGLNIQSTTTDDEYWKYSREGEKICSIFLHLSLEYSKEKIIYENHAGSEQGYFELPDGTFESIKKKQGKPDLIILDKQTKMIYLIEAEKGENAFIANKGVNQLSSFTEVEKKFCSKYLGYKFARFVIIFGDEIVSDDRIVLQLKTDGTVIFGKKCPNIIKNAIQNLINFNKE